MNLVAITSYFEVLSFSHTFLLPNLGSLQGKFQGQQIACNIVLCSESALQRLSDGMGSIFAMYVLSISNLSQCRSVKR